MLQLHNPEFCLSFTEGVMALAVQKLSQPPKKPKRKEKGDKGEKGA